MFYFLCELIFQDDLESHDQKLAELTALGSKLIELSQVLQLLHYFRASRVLFSVLFVCLLCFCMKCRSLGLPVCFYLCLKPIFCEIHAFFKGKTHSLHGFIPTSYTVWFSLRIYHLEMVQNQSNIFQFCIFDFYLVLLWVDIVFIKSWSLFDLGKKPISRMYLFPIFCFCHTHGFFSMGRIHSPHDLCRFIIELIIFCSIIILTNLQKGWSHPFQYLYEEMVSLSFVQ